MSASTIYLSSVHNQYMQQPALFMCLDKGVSLLYTALLNNLCLINLMDFTHTMFLSEQPFFSQLE